MADPARLAVARVLSAQAEVFPRLAAPEEGALSDGLPPEGVARATALYRETLRRWGTLGFLVGRFHARPLDTMQPELKASIWLGACELLFLDTPAHAAVDEAVALAREGTGDARAAGVANAILRRLAAAVGERDASDYAPAADRLPVPAADGRFTTRLLTAPLLPPVEQGGGLPHLVAAASIPKALATAWAERFGLEEARRLALQALRPAPVIVSAEAGFAGAPGLAPHAEPGFFVWEGGAAAGTLASFLAGHPQRRVQDPTAAATVRASAGLQPRRILDYCAGKGTKTRQLALLHPAAEVVATDVDPSKRRVMQASVADLPNVKVVGPDQIAALAAAAPFDLVLLDAPCTNSGVFARRVEAKWRFGPGPLGELTTLQREIIATARPWAAPGGHVLWATCSIESGENEKMARRLGGEIVHAAGTVPQGWGASHRDGGYHALVAL